MVAIITGDIVNSRLQEKPETYLNLLKNALSFFGEENNDWEIFRGDSFQLKINTIEDAFYSCLYIKACLKSHKDLDARMAIGLGSIANESIKISEATGSAFIYSGQIFEKLKTEKSNLQIKTDNESLNLDINVSFQLALIAMNNWLPNAAEVVKLSIENPNISQKELGSIIGIKQNTVSERLKRAYFQELLQYNEVFKQKLNELKNQL